MSKLLFLKIIAVVLNVPVMAQNQCDVFTINERLVANCSNKGITDVPQDLNEKIQVLDLSYNYIKVINAESFARYKELVELYMIRMKLAPGADLKKALARFTFQSLQNVKYLDITGSYYNDWPSPDWPPNIVKLIINDCGIKTLDLSKAGQLEELYANDNDFGVFPTFNPDAPITIIHIERNPVQYIELVEIAPFCKLKIFGFQIDDGKALHNEINFCECKKIDLWLAINGIKVTHELNCTIPQDPDDQHNRCTSWFTPEEKSLYNACLAKVVTKEVKTIPVLLVIVLGTVASLMAIILIAIIFLARRKARRERTAEAIRAGEETEEEEINQ